MAAVSRSGMVSASSSMRGGLLASLPSRSRARRVAHSTAGSSAENGTAKADASEGESPRHSTKVQRLSQTERVTMVMALVNLDDAENYSERDDLSIARVSTISTLNERDALLLALCDSNESDDIVEPYEFDNGIQSVNVPESSILPAAEAKEVEVEAGCTYDAVKRLSQWSSAASVCSELKTTAKADQCRVSDLEIADAEEYTEDTLDHGLEVPLPKPQGLVRSSNAQPWQTSAGTAASTPLPASCKAASPTSGTTAGQSEQPITDTGASDGARAKRLAAADTKGRERSKHSQSSTGLAFGQASSRFPQSRTAERTTEAQQETDAERAAEPAAAEPAATEQGLSSPIDAWFAAQSVEAQARLEKLYGMGVVKRDDPIARQERYVKERPVAASERAKTHKGDRALEINMEEEFAAVNEAHARQKEATQTMVQNVRIPGSYTRPKGKAAGGASMDAKERAKLLSWHEQSRSNRNLAPTKKK